MGVVSSGQQASDLQETFEDLLADINAGAASAGVPVSAQLRDPRLTSQFSKKLAEFTETWGANYPENMRRIEEARADLERWIDESTRSVLGAEDYPEGTLGVERADITRTGLQLVALASGVLVSRLALVLGAALGRGLIRLIVKYRYGLIFLAGSLFGRYIVGEEQRSELLDRMTGASGPIQQFSNAVQQGMNTAAQQTVNNVAQQAVNQARQSAADLEREHEAHQGR